MTISLLLTWGIPAGVAAQESAQKQADQHLPRVNASAPESSSVKPVNQPHRDEFSGITDTTLRSLPRDLLEDQKQIWTSPARLRFSDTQWLVPLAGIEAGLFATDASFSRHLSQSPSTISHYKNLSNAGVGALIGGAAGMWALGKVKHNDHWTETGFLAGEAALNSLAVVEGMKYTLRRERPFQGDGSGSFFHGGTSFPSEHAAAAWSVAGVIAHEYPGTLSKVMAYGLASLVSFSRIRAHQHFPSDVLAGTIIGNLVAQNVFSRRHDPELGGEAWEPIRNFFADRRESNAYHGSPYVPLDSWIYPVLDRLAAMGFVDAGFAGIRPWTRLACSQMVVEAQDRAAESTVASELVNELAREFRSELSASGESGNAGFRVESIYSRTQHISGMPLVDGYDLAQTAINDFGRPYGQGWNTVNGFSAYVTDGPWVAYVRGEEQTAPSIPALPLPARQAIEQAYENADSFQLPLRPGSPQPAVKQFDLLDAYVGFMVSNWQVSFGKQSLWWGSGQGTSLELSNNAGPINMFRINRTTPLKLPSILGWLGPMRTEFFLGQLSGFEFIDSPGGLVGQWGQALPKQPFINGQNISFKPTRNFEFGFYRTTIFGGEGYPFTLHALARSLFNTGNADRAAADKPGNRTSGLDFSYRLPHLRDWVTFYGDGYTDDQFSPIAYADRSAWHAGLYFSHFPIASRLDLRVEGVYTDIPGGGGAIRPGSFYANGTWRSGYTNDGNLMGSWVGRGGQGAQAWTNYWFNGRNRLQFNFRHQKVSQQFLSGGGTLTDAGVQGDCWVRPYLSVSASVQVEQWLFPAIQPNPGRNVTASVQVSFQPQKTFRPTFHHLGQNEADSGDSN